MISAMPGTAIMVVGFTHIISLNSMFMFPQTATWNPVPPEAVYQQNNA
jgi:hypothetical protein